MTWDSILESWNVVLSWVRMGILSFPPRVEYYNEGPRKELCRCHSVSKQADTIPTRMFSVKTSGILRY